MKIFVLFVTLFLFGCQQPQQPGNIKLAVYQDVFSRCMSDHVNRSGYESKDAKLVTDSCAAAAKTAADFTQ